MKAFKLKTTRPEFLLNLMGGNAATLTESEMKKALHDSCSLVYCAYTVLMEADIDQKDVVSVHNDGESIAVTFQSKAEAKRVAKICRDSQVRYGSEIYDVCLKLRDRHVIVTVSQIEEDEGPR